MVYVDLNPVRAGEVRELIECHGTSTGELQGAVRDTHSAGGTVAVSARSAP